MDTSEIYIEQCEKAIKDISWKPEIGDYIYRKYSVFGEELDKQIWKESDCREIVILHYHSEVPGYYHGVTTDGEPLTVNFKCSNDEVKATSIPLFRQDQLQEMVGEFDKCLHMIYWWTTGGYNSWGYENDSFTSMEQLWLALVMHEKYGKTWNGEDWVSR